MTKNKILLLILVSICLILTIWIYQTKLDFFIKWKIIPKGSMINHSQINILKFEIKPHQFMKSSLLVGNKNIFIFLHGPQDFISQHIINTGNWEIKWINEMLLFAKGRTSMQLLDLGCNLGVYSLSMAAFGHKVIAVDANRNNTDRLVQSVIANGFQKNVNIVSNAISDVHKEFSMNSMESNIGGQNIVEKKNNSYFVKSIWMDELLPLVNKTMDTVIKIDIQGSEIDSIKKASELFDKCKIIAILIEWILIKTNKEIYILISFFMSRNYRPYSTFFSTVELDISNIGAWPYDVVWRKI